LIDGGASSRLIKSFERVDVTLAGVSYSLRSRISGRNTDGSGRVTVNLSENGDKRQMAVHRDFSGFWHVDRKGGGGDSLITYRRNQVTVSSLDLLDPEMYRLFAREGRATVLDLNSGELVSGVVAALGESEMVIGGESVIVRNFELRSDTGLASFSWSSDGLLLAYAIDLLGTVFEARVRTVPTTRSWGDVSPVTGGVDMHEEQL